MAKFLLIVRTHTYFLLLYIAAVALVYLMWPRESTFPYEFQQGRIWSHADYYSPFDAPLLKSKHDIDAETDSLRKHFVIYYKYNAEVETLQVTRFTQTLQEHWAKSSIPAFRRDFLLEAGRQALDSVYRQGIVQEDDAVPQHLPGDPITVTRNNVGEEMTVGDVLSQKAAYEQVMNMMLANAYTNERSFVKDLDMNNFIQPNLIYNADITNTAKAEVLSRISPTKGVIPMNRKVIARGEVVNAEKFMALQSIKYEFEHRIGSSSSFWAITTGQILVIIICFGMVYLFLMYFRKEFSRNLARTGFILLLILLFSGLACLIVRNDYSIYAIPFVLLPVIIATFFDARTASFMLTVTTLLLAFLAPNPFEFVFLNFITGIISIANVGSLYRRGSLFKCVLRIVGTYSLIYTAMFLLQGVSFKQIEWMNYIYFAISGILLFVFYPSIFLFEKIFGFISDITLMELSDTNQPLLRRMSEVAPGTFQHSLQVANLAEEVIQKIGGNPLLVRTGALYHDIGKLSRPAYFIENQAGGHNPHDDLDPVNSAQILIDHIHNGVETAKKHRLPSHIVNFIRTHHGTTITRYFYHAYQVKHPGEAVDRSRFTYPGPIPFSKEMVIVMMCDSIEAASRSLKEKSHKSLSDLVDNVVNFQVAEDQYNDADITYRDINTAKKIIKNRLMSIYHVRIEYPKD